MKFTAYERTLQGTGASRRLRNASKVPGIVYGAGEPVMIELDHNALFFALKKEAFHSSIQPASVFGGTSVCTRCWLCVEPSPMALVVEVWPDSDMSAASARGPPTRVARLILTGLLRLRVFGGLLCGGWA